MNHRKSKFEREHNWIPIKEWEWYQGNWFLEQNSTYYVLRNYVCHTYSLFWENKLVIITLTFQIKKLGSKNLRISPIMSEWNMPGDIKEIIIHTLVDEDKRYQSLNQN